jgi:chromosome segregation protein
MLTQGATSDAFALLGVLADPARAKAALDQLKAQQAEIEKRIGELQKTLAQEVAAQKKLDEMEKAQELKGREQEAEAVKLAEGRQKLEDERADFNAEVVAAETQHKAEAEKLAETERGLKALAEENAKEGRYLSARENAVAQREAAVADVEAELAQMRQALEDRKERLSQALAS